jgi:hypothetical protein
MYIVLTPIFILILVGQTTRSELGGVSNKSLFIFKPTWTFACASRMNMASLAYSSLLDKAYKEATSGESLRVPILDYFQSTDYFCQHFTVEHITSHSASTAIFGSRQGFATLLETTIILSSSFLYMATLLSAYVVAIYLPHVIRLMADPVSAAGTAIGVVSLGLSLCQGLTYYLHALRCRRVEIESTSRQVDCLRSAFVVIKEALPKLSSDHQSAREVIERCLLSCEDEIKRLAETLNELKKDQPTSASLNQKLQVQAGKLSYPFNQRNLRRLEDSVQKVKSILSTALQATELFVTLLSFSFS